MFCNKSFVSHFCFLRGVPLWQVIFKNDREFPDTGYPSPGFRLFYFGFVEILVLHIIFEKHTLIGKAYGQFTFPLSGLGLPHLHHGRIYWTDGYAQPTSEAGTGVIVQGPTLELPCAERTPLNALPAIRALLTVSHGDVIGPRNKVRAVVLPQ